MILSHITAMSQNGVIGAAGKLPWHIPEDLKFFKNKTKGHLMILGRKTYESTGALPNRFHIIITRDPNYDPKSSEAVVVADIGKALEAARELTPKYGDEVFISGGGEIYAQTMDIVDRIYLTVIYKNFEGDTTYPSVDSNKFKLVDRQDRTEPIPFAFLTYERR